MKPASVSVDIDALYFDQLRLEMRKYMALMEKAERAYLRRDAVLRGSYPEGVALTIAERDDTTLNNHARNVGFYGDMAVRCSAALQGELAHRLLTQDRPAPRGEAVRPAPSAASVSAAGESVGGVGAPRGAGANVPLSRRAREGGDRHAA